MRHTVKWQFDRLTRELKKATLTAERKTVKQGMRKAIKLSSGPGYSNTPYAVNDPKPGPSPNPEVINVKTGSFKRDWKSASSPVSDGVRAQIRNDNKVADWLDKGTRKMIRRPIRDAIEKAITRVRNSNLYKAIKRL